MLTSNRGLWLIFGLLGLIWGSSYIFIKIGVESLGPFTLVSLRLLFAGSFLAIVVRISREPLPRDPRTLRHLAVVGMLSIFFPFSLITWGELHVTSGLAAGVALVNARQGLRRLLRRPVPVRPEA